jgi:uncharacterized DUF497 family protein
MQQFEWNPDEARINLRKHGISFEQAKTIWQRPIVIEVDDRHAYRETRFKATGIMSNLACIVVIYVEGQTTIRIIFARPAEREERRNYYEHYGYSSSAG